MKARVRFARVKILDLVPRHRERFRDPMWVLEGENAAVAPGAPPPIKSEL